MAMQFGSVTLSNPSWLYGFLFLVPFVLIYLIRPRPTLKEIPSLMFFLTSERSASQQSFLKKFVKDWLFWIQLLALLLLIIHLLGPITTYQEDITAENTVIILDVSGSSQVRESGTTRFAIGMDLAKDALGGKNTIILAKGIPKIIARDVPRGDALDSLRSVQPLATPSAIGESIVLAGEILGSNKGRVIVISDFINTVGIDPGTAKLALEARGIVVDLFNTIREKGRRSNVGIINLVVEDESTTVFIHNFDEVPRQATLTVGALTKDLTIPAETTETFSFQTPAEIAKVSLDVRDDFSLDNTAYISVPDKKQVKILIISNNHSIFLRNAALSSDQFSVEMAEPPIVPRGDYDVYMVHHIDAGSILPGTLSDIAKKVDQGAALVIHAQDNSETIDYEGLLPVKISGKGTASLVQVDQITSFTKNINFGGMEEFLFTEARPNIVTIASIGDSPIIAFQQRGLGKVVYYGILEEASGFKLAPSYPIFWVKLLEFLVDQENIENLNQKTGDTLILGDVTTIQTPTTWLRQNVLLFEEIGIYSYEDRKVASSMMDGDESNINAKEIIGAQVREVQLKPVTEEREFDWGIPLLIIVIFILIMELIYVKARGDI